jgi:hypothetical protein
MLFRNRGYCRFGEWCHFLHIVSKVPGIEKIKAENEAILEKLIALVKLLLEKDKELERKK